MIFPATYAKRKTPKVIAVVLVFCFSAGFFSTRMLIKNIGVAAYWYSNSTLFNYKNHPKVCKIFNTYRIRTSKTGDFMCLIFSTVK